MRATALLLPLSLILPLARPFTLLRPGDAKVPNIRIARWKPRGRRSESVAPGRLPPLLSQLTDGTEAASSPQSDVRGDCYGASNNSTIPTPAEVAASVGVAPTIEVSKETWKRMWRLHGKMLPVLHAFDACKPKDSSLSLRCLWLKALSGNDPSSPVYDDGMSYDLLPRGTRIIVGGGLRGLYPRLHHGNIEMRTAFLDRAIANVVDSVRAEGIRSGEGAKKIRLISLGAGYDPRSVKLAERGLVDAAAELDLPEVVEVKQKQYRRLLRRRPQLRGTDLPELIPADLNHVNDVSRTLDELVTRGDPGTWGGWHTIFIFEGVLIYLDEGVPSSLLRTCGRVLSERGLTGSLCFADRLENVPGGDRGLGRAELGRNGWELVEWCPKPGLARHMGSARLISSL